MILNTLISYLTARYGDFKFDEIKGELETIFSLQYGITVEEKVKPGRKHLQYR